ncbi:MAG: Hsp20/alpha crystallin family protein [Acidimicrobiales bacterium]
MLRQFDPLFEFATTPTASLDYDVVRSDDGVELNIAIPGVDPETVDVTVDGRTLRLDASRDFDVAEGAQRVSRRRRPNAVRQTFQIGENLDASQLTADYDLGVLTVRIPVAESAKPRKVAVGAGAPAIDTASTEADAE